MDLLEQVTLEDLEPKYREIADVIGIGAFVKLVRYAAGSPLSIPTEKTVVISLRNRQIIKEYNGYNVPQLALKYGLTDASIYEILKKHKKIQLENQQSLFD